MPDRIDMDPRERIERYLQSWGHNALIPVRADDLRAILAAYDEAFAKGWNQAADAFGGIRIVREPR